ncbi:MAG: glycosyltransferase [Anaerolineae bacterium]|nr:glycosyltransferase [Anaerolineae bacterium]
MNNKPLVSVIIIVKNGERFLRQAIDSVLAQNYTLREIIVVDGQSEDKTAEIAQSFEQVSYIRQTNKGVADAYNLGIEVATGDLIAFLSHDDLWLPHKLNRQVDQMQRQPHIQYTVTKIKFFLEPGCAIPAGFKPELLEGGHVGRIMETLVARKSLFNWVGKFDDAYSIANDVDWYARVKDQNIPMAVIPEVLVHKRIHDKNTAADAQANNQQLLQILRRSLHRKRSQND